MKALKYPSLAGKIAGLVSALSVIRSWITGTELDRLEQISN